MEKLASKCVLAYIPLFSPARCRQSQLKDSPHRRSHARRSRHSYSQHHHFPSHRQCSSSSQCSLSLNCPYTSSSTSHYPCSTCYSSTQPSSGHNCHPLSCEGHFSWNQRYSSSISSSPLHISGSPLHVSDRYKSRLADVIFISVSTFLSDVIYLIEIVPYLLDIVLHLILINPCHSVTLYISPEFYLISSSSHHTSSLSSLSSSRRHDCSSCSDYSLCHQHRFSSTHHGVHTSHLHRCSSSFPWYHSSTHSPTGVNMLQSHCGSLMRVLTPPVRREVQLTRWKTSKLLKKGRKLNRKYMRLKEERKQRIKKARKGKEVRTA